MDTVDFTIDAEECSALSTVYANWQAASSSFSDGILTVSAEHADAIGALLQDNQELKKKQLLALKTSLKANVDAAAEIERLKFITPGVGQALTYQQKAEEAKACLASSQPDAEDYPLLSAEIGITASDLMGVAQIVSNAYAQWRVVGAAIEAVRLSAKAAIDTAPSFAAADEAASSVVWPSF